MEKKCLALAVCLLTSTIIDVAATVRYVNADNATPISPYTSWDSAATDIQSAIDVASKGDLILVTNGLYQTGGVVFGGMTNRVAVTKPMVIQSVNGPAVTIIKGHQVPGTINGDQAIRCVALTNGASLVGFTLTNGATTLAASGGGAYGFSKSATMTNCIIVGNSAYSSGGGVQGCTLHKCILAFNQISVCDSFSGGGGACSSDLNSCSISNNYILGDTGFSSGGAGCYACILTNCIVCGNASLASGGGVYQSVLMRCLVRDNMAADSGGGAMFSRLNNCLVTDNFANFGGGVSVCYATNCTIVGNSAHSAGGAQCGGSINGVPPTLNNCIVYFNMATINPNYTTGGVFNCSCTLPLPENGTGNIAADPLFVDDLAGNYRLQPGSPCIDSGSYVSATGSTDLDGRLRRVGSNVDLGAYEFQGAGMGEYIHWLQQYGLPTDGSGDSADADADGLNNRKEWFAGTVPTDGASVLKMLPPVSNGSSTTVSWESVSGRTYFLERSGNLNTDSFVSVQNNIAGLGGITTYTVTNAFGAGPFFYRIGIQP